MASAADLAALQTNTDAFFLVTNGAMVFFLQAGFGLLEAGAVRSKNAASVMLNTVVRTFVGLLAYWLMGFAFAYGNTGEDSDVFIGSKYFALKDVGGATYAVFFYQFTMAITASTIVSGAVSERCQFMAYVAFSFVITGFIAPIAIHWRQAPDAWLYKGTTYTWGVVDYRTSYVDVAGSGVIHLLGGSCALVAATILGARIGRFDSQGRPRDIRGHSTPLMVFGGLVILFGYIGLNGGAVGRISAVGDAELFSLAVVNTFIAGCFGGLTALAVRHVGFYTRGRRQTYALCTINGAITGMTAVASGLTMVEPWAAAATGLIGGMVYVSFSALFVRIRIDDPLNAISVHMGGGLWGLLASPLLMKSVGVVYAWDKHSGMRLAWNAVGALAIMGWAGVCSILLFGALRLVRAFRLKPGMEKRGLDMAKYNEAAYSYGGVTDGYDDDESLYSEEFGPTRKRARAVPYVVPPQSPAYVSGQVSPYYMYRA